MSPSPQATGQGRSQDLAFGGAAESPGGAAHPTMIKTPARFPPPKNHLSAAVAREEYRHCCWWFSV